MSARAAKISLVIAIAMLITACVPADVVRRVESLETRVAVLETCVYPIAPTATATSARTATRTATPTLASTATATQTFVPAATSTPTLTAAPTPGHGGTLEIGAPATFRPASTIVLELVWTGEAAQVSLAAPSRTGYYGAAGDCGATCWTLTDETTYVEIWMFSTWQSGEVATFIVTATRSGQIVAQTSVSLTCVAGDGAGTPTPTRTPTRAVMSTPTATTAVSLVLPVRTWVELENATRAETLWLKVCNSPVGAPAGPVWSFSADGTPLDYEWATARSWLQLETGGGAVRLFADTFLDVQICAMVWRGRETWSPDCTPVWVGPGGRGYPDCVRQ